MLSGIGFFNLKKFYARVIDNVIINLINYACESNPLLKFKRRLIEKSSRTVAAEIVCDTDSQTPTQIDLEKFFKEGLAPTNIRRKLFTEELLGSDN